jgi:hypothetical protein
MDKYESSSPKKWHIYLILIVALIIVHFSTGVFLMPAVMYRQHSEYNIPLLHLKIGYGLGMLLWCGIVLPLVFSLLALIKRTNRNFFSFLKVYFYLCIVGLVINVLIGITMRNI